MSNHLLCKRIMSVMLVLALVFSIFPMAVYAEENTATVSFSIDGTSYKVDMKFEDDLLYCRADQWAEAADCLWVFNSDQQRLLFFYDGPTILASYDDQEYIADGSNMWVPFFDAATQTGVYFSEVSGFTVCGYRAKPLAVFYKDMDRMFGISKYRTSEMIIELGGVWALISSASRAYAILSSLSIEGFLDAVSGKMDQDMYDAVLLDLLKTDETLLGAITGIGETLDRPGKVISTLQKSLDEGGAFVKLLEQMGFSESEIREIVWDLSQEVYGSKLLNDLADLYDFNQKTHFLDLLGLLDDMTISLEADAHTIMAMETVLANSESTQISSATKKAIGLRTENKTIKAEAYLESLGDILWDNAIEKMGDVVKETTDVKTLRKLGAKAFVWVFDKSLSMTETTNAIMYSDVYSQIQLELTSYYYRHRDYIASDNALTMHSVALLYLRSCLAAWRMFEYDESLSQPISNATSMLTAEITNLMQYTEDELLQSGTSEETTQAITDLVLRKCSGSEQEILFNNTYWVWIKGETNGSVYVVLFHKDGTMEYCHAVTQSYGAMHYTYADDILMIDGVEYRWDGDNFTSTEKYESQHPDGMYYSLSLDSDGTWWRPLLEEVLDARASFFSEMEQAQNIDKRLVQVKEYDSDGGIMYDFKYDSNGLITEIVETRYGSYWNEYLPESRATTFAYDDNHHLINRNNTHEIEEGYFVGQTGAYSYSDSGLLNASEYLELEGGGCNVSYEYDIRNHLDIATADYDTMTNEYRYIYDAGTKTMMLQKSSWFNEGIISDYAVCDGSESYSISYQYKPFVVYGNGYVSLLDSYGNGNALNYDTGSLLFYLSEFGLSDPQYFSDGDGYLIKVVDGSVTYELSYE